MVEQQRALAPITCNVDGPHNVACNLQVPYMSRGTPVVRRTTYAAPYQLLFNESSAHPDATRGAALTSVGRAALQVASLRGPGRVVVTTAPDDTTNPPPMQRCVHSGRYIAVHAVLVAEVGLCRWVADHIPGAELLVQQPGWGHAHCFIAEVG